MTVAGFEGEEKNIELSCADVKVTSLTQEKRGQFCRLSGGGGFRNKRPM